MEVNHLPITTQLFQASLQNIQKRVRLVEQIVKFGEVGLHENSDIDKGRRKRCRNMC